MVLLQYKPPEILISQINPSYIDKEISTKGTIQSISQTPGLYILTLKQNNSTIPVIIFREQNLTFSNQIKVLGMVSQYNNKLEILAKEIKNVY